MIPAKRIYLSIVLLFLLLQSIKAEEPLVTFSVHNAPIEQVLLQIEKQIGLHVSFESSLLTDIPPVTLSMTTLPMPCLRRFLSLKIRSVLTEGPS